MSGIILPHALSPFICLFMTSRVLIGDIWIAEAHLHKMVVLCDGGGGVCSELPLRLEGEGDWGTFSLTTSRSME